MERAPESLKCPVCFEVFPGNVFQCIEGHAICQICYYKVSECPQCRVQLGNVPIRCRVVENLVQELRLTEKVPCPFKSSGCEEITDIRFVQDHVDKCIHNAKLFGPLVSVCKHTGHPDCNFKMNFGNVPEAIEHFCKEHRAHKYTGTSIQSTLSNLSEGLNAEYNPIVFDHRSDGFALLIIRYAAPKDLLITPYILGYYGQGGRVKVPMCEVRHTFTTEQYNNYGQNTISVSATAMDILKAEEYCAYGYHSQVPIRPLKRMRIGSSHGHEVPFRIDLKIKR